MTHNIFSVPIFFIVFRETLEASIIIATLLGLVEQLVYSSFHTLDGQTISQEDEKKEIPQILSSEVSGVEVRQRKRRLLRKMRFQECHTPHLGHITSH